MKIIQVNNFHYMRGGSERSYFDTGNLLSEKGHEVRYFSTRHPQNEPAERDDLFCAYNDLTQAYDWRGKIKIFRQFLNNKEAARNFQKLIDEFSPDVVHLHNIYHHLSPSIIRVAKKSGIPIVMTLHDYKLISPNYNLYHRGAIWEPGKKRFWRTIKERAVGDSFAKSLACAWEDFYHNRIQKIYNQVDIFISPSKFLLAKFLEHGFTNDITHLPNILKEDIEMTEAPSTLANYPYIVYFGRLSEEKGVRELVAAYKKSRIDYKLLIVGDGPLKKPMENFVINSNLYRDIKFVGHKTGQDLWSIIKGAEFVVLSSRWYENAPYSIVEAMSLGKVVVAPDIGGIGELIYSGRTGYLYQPRNEADLVATLKHVSRVSEKDRAWVGVQAREKALDRHNQETYYKSLMYIYDQAINKQII